MQKKLLLVVTALGAMTLAACDQGKTSGIVADPLNATMVADFSKGKSEEIYASNGWSNGGGFNAVWTSDNVTYSDGKMKLSIQDKEAEADGVKYPHTAGEARTHKLYGYGDYEVRMKPTNVVGSVSTFFTYTDKWNKVNGVENKHDEIDIEFLGKDTTKVQFNYFVGGQGGHEHMHDLGFDASQGFHNYGFRWAEKSITWFVDGQPVYQVNKDNPAELPSQNGRMMASYWPSSISSWSGTYEGPSDKTCEYEWIKSSGDTIYADGEAPVPPFDNKINWDSISKTDLEFGADPTDTGYTVTKVDGVTTIAYDQPKAWKNVQAEAVDVVNSNDAVSLVLKNNSATESTIRVDVQGENKVGNRDALNEMAIAYGTDAEVSTDPEWGGSKLTLKAGEEARLVVKYDVTTNRGLAKNILIFADSLSENPAAHQGGNITVKDIKFGSTTGTPIVPPTPEPTPTVNPWEDIDPVDVTFSDTPDYTVVKEEGVTTVTYSQASNWENIIADVRSLANGENDALGLKLKNNGTTNVAIRVDVQGENKVGNTDCLNTSASASDGRNVSTDTDWGGSTLTLKAGEEIILTVNYATDTTKGAAKNVLIYLDSLQSTPKVNNGNVSISEVKFGNFDEDVPSEPTPVPVDPEPAPGPTPTEDPWKDIDPVDVTFVGGADYTITKSEGVTNVTYSQASGWENLSTDIRSLANGENDAVGVKFKNNGTTSVAVRVDVQGVTKVGNTDCLNTSASASDGRSVATDTEWGGSTFTIKADEELVITVNYATDTDKGAAKNLLIFLDSHTGSLKVNDGDIDISEVKFGNFSEDVPEDPTPVPVDPEPTPEPTPEPEPTPTPEPGPAPVDPVVVPDLDENAAALTFWKNTEDYTATSSESNKILSVSYSELVGNSYACVGANDLSGAVSATTDTVSVNITNKGTADAKVRIDTHHKTGDTTSDPLHVSASATGDIVGTVDYSGDGVILTVKANSNANLVITIDQSSESFDKLVIFVDSCNASADKKSGEVVFSSFVFSGEATPTPEPGPTPTPTPSPETKTTLMFTTDNEYTIENDTTAGTSHITYESVTEATYHNVQAPLTDLEEGTNRVSFKITNAGAENVKFTFKVQIGSAETSYCTALDSYDYFGADKTVQYNVAAGNSRDIVIAFDGTVGANNLVAFINTGWAAEPATFTNGDITISDVAFEVVEDSGIDWSSIDALDVAVWSGNVAYSVEKSGTVNTVTYSSASEWACCGAYVTSAATDKNIMAITFTNNSEIDSNIRLDLQSTIADDKNVPVTSVTSDGDASKNDNNEINFSVAAGKSITLEVTYAASEENGNIKNLMFYIDSMQAAPLAHEGGSISISNIKFALEE